MPRGARAPLPLHFTTCCTRNMTTRLLLLQLVCVWLSSAVAEPAPAPGRVPKVYNALITSNQNLEPSKAYPVYQPVIHDPFAYPFQPTFFYGDYPISNNLNPAVVQPPQQPKQPAPPSLPPADQPQPSSEAPPKEPSPQESSSDPSTPALPQVPSTQSPIPLNQFGLPSQVLPLGQFNPAYDGFTQIGPISGPLPYPYPGLRFYDPYNPYNLNPYANLPPFYRPLPSVFSQAQPGAGPPPPAPPTTQGPPASQPLPSDSSAPPPEPSDLNALNYASKDPSIPNVPPPPLPQGGLNDDKAE